MQNDPSGSRFQRGFWRFTEILTEICLLSMLWLVFSLPIVTIGASTTAMYSCTMRFILNGEKRPGRTFWREFKACFKRSTIVFVPLLLLIAALALDGWFYLQRDTAAATGAAALVFALLTVTLLLSVVIFPYMARYDNRPIEACRKAAMFAMKSILPTLGALFITLAVPIAALVAIRVMLLITPGVTAYLNSMLLLNVYKKNIPTGRGTPRF